MKLIVAHDFYKFLSPDNLALQLTPLKKVLLIGGCIFDTWIDVISNVTPEVEVNHWLFQQAMGASSDQNSYDLRIAQVPLRAVLPEYLTMSRSYADTNSYDDLFKHCVDFLKSHVDAVSLRNGCTPTLFLNYMPPQQNSLGRLLPRYDLRNPIYFIEELNRSLYDIVSRVPNSSILDIANLGGVVGRQRFQDDAFCLNAHGGFVTDYDYPLDGERLEAGEALTSRFDFSVENAVKCFWFEAMASYRVLRGIDRIKMLCVDLDDTLWRGVMAEQEDIDPIAMEGWPLGIAEALAILKQRGVILCIISKNEEARIQEIWPQLFAGKLSLDDFAIRKIGWKPKPQALSEAIREANVLPESVAFLDDNPVERAQINLFHPLVRVIEAPHLDWRRILLWSPELQTEVITEESVNRNSMIGAQTRRELQRETMDREDFLQSLGLKVEMRFVESVDDSQFARAFELVNKTNQFNTNGKRWTDHDARVFFQKGGRWIRFQASDKYTNYGIVGVVIVSNGNIDQFVMSCRVFGLDIEHAVLAKLSETVVLKAIIVETEKNGPCRSVFRECGWTLSDNVWKSEAGTMKIPRHIEVVG